MTHVPPHQSPPGGQAPGWGPPPAPPGATPSGWGPGGQPPGQPPKRNPGPVVFLVLVLVAVIGGGAVLLLSGDDGDGGQGGGRPGEDQQASGQTPATMPGGGARPTIPDELPTIPEEGAGGPDGTLSEGVLPTVDPDANGNLPEDVVVDLYEALSAGDCAAIREAMAESLFTNDGAMTEDESMAACERQPVQETRVENVQFAGFRPEPDPAEPRMLPNSAGVVGDVVTDGQTYEHVFFLILEDGLWRVYLT